MTHHLPRPPEYCRSQADPFGDDIIDFKLEKFLSGYYKNALAHLASIKEPNGDVVPDEDVASPIASFSSKKVAI